MLSACLVEELDRATTWDEIAGIVSSFVSKVLEVSSLSLIPSEPRDGGAPDGHDPRAFLSAGVFRILASESSPQDVVDLSPIEHVFERMLPTFGSVASTVTLQRDADQPAECIRSVPGGRGLIGLLGCTRDQLGIMVACRSLSERPFSDEELGAFDEARRRVETALRRLRVFCHSGFDPIMAALDALPIPALLFDGEGRLLWLSEEAQLRLSVGCVRVGGVPILGRTGPELERLEGRALAVASSSCAEIALERLELLETIRVRRVAGDFGGGCAVALVILPDQPVASPRRQSEQNERAALCPACLTLREAEVALLAGRGFSTLNISAALGISESTVRTHLRAVYAKLGVSNRAELACRLALRER